jgi:hypothetical protein
MENANTIQLQIVCCVIVMRITLVKHAKQTRDHVRVVHALTELFVNKTMKILKFLNVIVVIFTLVPIVKLKLMFAKTKHVQKMECA